MPRVRGVDVAVSDAGEGLTFLWSHGFASNRAQDERSGMLDWGRLASRHRIVRWDARGHGESDGTSEPEEYRWENLGFDLLGLAHALAVERFVAGGVSMGAAVALHAATRAPERIVGLVLVLPPTAYETRKAQADDYLIGAALVEREGIDRYVEHMNAQPLPAIVREVAAGYSFTPAVPRRFLPAVLRGAAASDLPEPEAVRAFDAPVLILAWDTDPGHPLATAARLLELLPDAELHVARHLYDVAAWTGLVDAFLTRFSNAAPTV
jgi:3-oxoadipate enol-lactonase